MTSQSYEQPELPEAPEPNPEPPVDQQVHAAAPDPGADMPADEGEAET